MILIFGIYSVKCFIFVLIIITICSGYNNFSILYAYLAYKWVLVSQPSFALHVNVCCVMVLICLIDLKHNSVLIVKLNSNTGQSVKVCLPNWNGHISRETKFGSFVIKA